MMHCRHRRRRSGWSGRLSRGTRLPRIEPLESRVLLAFNPTGLEQELFQLVNRFRADPQGELSRLVPSLSPPASSDPLIQQQLDYWGVRGSALSSQWKQLTPVPPLAWSESLYTAARGHNLAMLQHDSQSHQLPGEPDPGARMQAAGYAWQRWGENIYAYPRTVMEAHGGFVINWGAGPSGIQDPPSHRLRLMRDEFVHVGVAVHDVGTSPSRSVGPLIVTQNLATPIRATTAYVVGAIFKQVNGSPWYVAGHGYGGVRILFEGTGGTFEATSLQAGGYQMQLPPGTYRARVTGGKLPTPLVSDEFVVGSRNVALDLLDPRDRAHVPVAVDDAYVVAPGSTSTFHVLANDRDGDGKLTPDSLSIVVGPTTGMLSVEAATGRVIYVAEAGFEGLDKFVYQVRDNHGFTSNRATARVVVLKDGDRPWQNPVHALDVNVDELVSSADALQVINALNAGRAGSLPVPTSEMLPPPLLDVTGDNFLSPRDAMVIINYLNDAPGAAGEGEGGDPQGEADAGLPWSVTLGPTPTTPSPRRLPEAPTGIAGARPGIDVADACGAAAPVTAGCLHPRGPATAQPSPREWEAGHAERPRGSRGVLPRWNPEETARQACFGQWPLEHELWWFSA